MALSPLSGLMFGACLLFQYQNVRADYVKAIWQVFNWEEIDKRYAKACK